MRGIGRLTKSYFAVALDNRLYLFDNIEIMANTMANTTAPHVGELEELMLLAVAQVGSAGETAGTPIREALAEVGRRVAIGTLYVTLGRLEAKGLIASRMSEATTERGGRAKRMFRLTGEGAEVLRVAEARRLQLRTKGALVGGVA